MNTTAKEPAQPASSSASNKKKTPQSPKKKDKKEQIEPPAKIEDPEKTKEEPSALSLPSKEIADKTKVFLGDKEYYVVSLDEVEKYKELKENYKEDSMSTFILYMHREFIKDLVEMRSSGKLKNVAKTLLGGFIFLIIIVLVIAIVFTILAISRR